MLMMALAKGARERAKDTDLWVYWCKSKENGENRLSGQGAEPVVGEGG